MARALAIDTAGHRLFVTQHGRDQLHANWPDLYKPEEEATLPAEELMYLEQGGDYGWPECYYDPSSSKLVLAPEYGGDGGKTRGVCAQKRAPVAAFPAHWAPNGMVFYDQQQFPARYRQGVFIAFHGSWDSAPYPQQGYNVVFQPLAGDHANGPCEIFADGFAGAMKSPEKALHRPSGLAVGPDGSLYVSDDVRGRIYRIVYRGGAADGDRRRAIHPVSERLGSRRGCRGHAAKPPEGTHPDAGAPAAKLPTPPGATRQWWRWAIASITAKWAVPPAPVATARMPRAAPLGPNLTGNSGCGAMAAIKRIAATINAGVPQPKQYRSPMPAMGGAQLTPEQVSAVAAYVWAVSHH